MALIPVDRNKQPLVSWKSYQKKLPTLEEVEAWKKRFNGRIAGWAMPTGVVSGIVALDFDGEKGIETMHNLDLKPNVKTPSGAYHVWVESPSYPVRTGAMSDKWPGMELKGDGGYVVVTGDSIRSKHSGSEPVIGGYEILNDSPTIANDLEDGLRQFIYQAKEEHIESAMARLIAEALEQTKDGRNNAGFWLACQLRDLGLPKQEALLNMTDNFLPNIPEGEHKYTKTEIKKSVDSAYSRPPRESERQAQIDVIISLVNNPEHELWHSEKDGFITLPDVSNLQIRSKAMREYLAGLFFKKEKTAVTRKTIDEALDTLEAIAKMDGTLYEPRQRIGWHENTCYVDMGKGYYKIDGLGYEPVEKPPIKFVRNESMGLIPTPIKGDGWRLLKKYVNVEVTDWPLLQSVLVAAFMPAGSFPVVAFTGKHGSGKSTLLSMIIALVDPRPDFLGARDSLPKDKRNLAIVAKYSLVLSFDNESHITGEISDALAMLSTGGQFKIRELWSDSGLQIFAAKRMVLINSIGDIVTESDLLDRSLIIECPPLDDNYWNDTELQEAFYTDRPIIIDAIFESVSQAIRELSRVRAPTIYRMTDYVKWSMASGVEGFLTAYAISSRRAPAIAISNSFIGMYIEKLSREKPGRNREKVIASNAAILEKPELEKWNWVSPFSALYSNGQNENSEWYRTMAGAINAYKRIKTDLKRTGVAIEEIQHNNQLWIAIKGEDVDGA